GTETIVWFRWTAIATPHRRDGCSPPSQRTCPDHPRRPAQGETRRDTVAAGLTGAFLRAAAVPYASMNDDTSDVFTGGGRAAPDPDRGRGGGRGGGCFDRPRRAVRAGGLGRDHPGHLVEGHRRPSDPGARWRHDQG